MASCTTTTKIKSALRCRRALCRCTDIYAELQQVLGLFLLNRNQPNPDNLGCRDGLALGFGFHQDTGFIAKHIGANSTRALKYVNLFKVPIWINLRLARVPMRVIVILSFDCMMNGIYLLLFLCTVLQSCFLHA